jgi:hypothetical protein
MLDAKQPGFGKQLIASLFPSRPCFRPWSTVVLLAFATTLEFPTAANWSMRGDER